MSEPFVGEIKMFAGNFNPRGWAFCDGQLLAVSQNDALFSLLGTIYGGDGRSTFGLPDMRGRIPIHAGSGPGLTPRNLGAKAGVEIVTLSANQLPSHQHRSASSDGISRGNAAGNVLATELNGTGAEGQALYSYGKNVQMAPEASLDIGGSQKHNNIMPFQCVSFIIALVGIYPSRN